MTTTPSAALDVDDVLSRLAPEVRRARLDGSEDAVRDAVLRCAA